MLVRLEETSLAGNNVTWHHCVPNTDTDPYFFFFFFNISFHTFFDQSDGTDGSAFFFEAEWCRYSRPDRSSAAHLKPVSLWLVVYPVLLGISRPRFTKISLRYLCPSKLMDSMADARLSVFILFLPISKLCGSHLGISTLGDLIAIKT